MNQALSELLSMAPAEKERRGFVFTAAEIAGQAGLWPTTYERFASFLPSLRPFLEEFLAHPRKSVVLTGAGTSEYVGCCLEGLLRRRLGVPVNVASTTALVVNPQDLFVPGHAILLVSFARSGSSPESLGAVRIAEALADPVYHLILTANAQGELAREAAALKRARLLVLDPRTNDRSLAMTGAFSNLVVAGQGLAHAGSFSEYERLFARIAGGGGRHAGTGAGRPGRSGAGGELRPRGVPGRRGALRHRDRKPAQAPGDDRRGGDVRLRHLPRPAPRAGGGDR